MSHHYANDNYASGAYASQGYGNAYNGNNAYGSNNNNSYADPTARYNAPSPYYGGNSSASSQTYMGSAPPAYSSQQHLVDPEAAAATAGASSSQRQYQRPLAAPESYSGVAGPAVAGAGASAGLGAGASSGSPFETVFDDHVYPANTHHSYTKPTPDTGYYGLGGSGMRSPSEDNMLANADGIPLRDRAGNNKGAESPDHVYDVPQNGRIPLNGGGDGGGSSSRGRKGRVRFGELGMLGANNKKRIPWMVYLFTLAQVAVFIAEIVKNGILTGSPIMIHPQFNPMIGPSTYVLINMGSRFVPCMHNVVGVQSSTVPINWPCPNTTTSDATAASNLCTLSELCGFNGVPEPLYDGNADQHPEPNQWFRFIVPIFLHAGIIHIGFNLLLQLTMGRDMERSIGSIRFFLVYVSSGIFGFVMGGNYAATGISSTGASGSLFGVIALTLLDLLYSWRDRRNPVKDLLFILLDVVISFVLGLLPGLDNFSHIGGFLMGLALGILVLHSPNALRRRIGEDDTTYASVSGTNSTYADLKSSAFFRSPVEFFRGRKPLWWGWWLLRAGAVVVVIVAFILLLNNFYYYHHTCSWCKYLSCLPVNNWCEVGNLQLTNVSNKRDLFSAAPRVVNLF
ncbi:rhomboid family membrane protein [Niveomyces insectorum RCEF 264]|uniref:Rhomboid-type serine protease n=1 Tax=Niveomyces insectorum RCEF 264 TaxID=1081102 RepID=A0A167TC36_9HYPO|nr:rhomboid family membrane protein [Niveomyces insectorum RCEF 264]